MQTHSTPDPAQTIDHLNSFLRGELSAVESYRLALDRLEPSEYRATLVQCSRSHQERARLLTEAIVGRGGEPAESSGAWGSLVRLLERSALAIGAAVLCACLVASQLAPQFIANATLARIIEESLILVGWVANWRPIEIYLYDWWPIRRRAQLYRRIAAAPVIVKAI